MRLGEETGRVLRDIVESIGPGWELLAAGGSDGEATGFYGCLRYDVVIVRDVSS